MYSFTSIDFFMHVPNKVHHSSSALLKNVLTSIPMDTVVYLVVYEGKYSDYGKI